MEWTQQENDAWTLNGAQDGGPRKVLGTVRYRDGSFWGQAEPTASGSGSLEQPGQLSEEQFEESMANLPPTLGPYQSIDDAKSAVEQAVRHGVDPTTGLPSQA